MAGHGRAYKSKETFPPPPPRSSSRLLHAVLLLCARDFATCRSVVNSDGLYYQRATTPDQNFNRSPPHPTHPNSPGRLQCNHDDNQGYRVAAVAKLVRDTLGGLKLHVR